MVVAFSFLAVQNITLPVIDAVDEGDELAVFIQRGEKLSKNTAERRVDYLRNGDMVKSVTMKY